MHIPARHIPTSSISLSVPNMPLSSISNHSQAEQKIAHRCTSLPLIAQHHPFPHFSRNRTGDCTKIHVPNNLMPPSLRRKARLPRRSNFVRVSRAAGFCPSFPAYTVWNKLQRTSPLPALSIMFFAKKKAHLYHLYKERMHASIAVLDTVTNPNPYSSAATPYNPLRSIAPPNVLRAAKINKAAHATQYTPVYTHLF